MLLAKSSSAEAMLDAAGWPDSTRNVMVVGHQPVLGDLLMLLLGATTPLYAMPKAGIWRLGAVRSQARVLIGVKAVIGRDSLRSAGAQAAVVS